MQMTRQEITLYLKATRQQRLEARMNVTSVIAVVLLPVFLLLDVNSDYVWGAVLGILIVTFTANSDLLGGPWRVTRNDLLKIIERQINLDPEALRHMDAVGKD